MEASAESSAVERVVLVGFMCAGKSAVGELLARGLGWAFVDLDRLIEEIEGRSVREIFARHGEMGFRQVEARVTADVARWGRMVLAPGGGWVTNSLVGARPGSGTLTAWLRVSAEEAVRRGAAAPGVRPLLAGADPLADARALLAARTPAYARADLAVDTEGVAPSDVAATLARAVHSRPAR
ncbi:MAG TPA: shikimate kinase [Longimicrobium sp.]|nr:shikimate kinase [Longimicrobium sp.]